MLLDYIEDCTKDYLIDYPWLNFKMYWVLMELQDYPKCINGHKIEPKKNFRIRVNAQTLEVTSNLAQNCNNLSCAQKSPRAVESRRKHFQETLGVDNPYQSPIVIKKIRARNKEKYGFEHAAQSPQIKELQKQRCQEKYGVDNCWQLPKVREILKQPEIQAKRIKSLKAHNQEHYGVDWFVQSDKFKEMTKSVGGVSKEEKLIVKWLKEFIDPNDIEVGTFKIIPPRQLDIFIKSKKIGIEFNGTFYHSIEHGTKVGYHLMKTTMCEELGIKLIHIWEDEWIYQNRMVKDFIVDAINGALNIEQYLSKRDDGLFEVDRSKFNKCMIPDYFEIVGEIQPEIIQRSKISKEKYMVPDCGKLILRRLSFIEKA